VQTEGRQRHATVFLRNLRFLIPSRISLGVVAHKLDPHLALRVPPCVIRLCAFKKIRFLIPSRISFWAVAHKLDPHLALRRVVSCVLQPSKSSKVYSTYVKNNTKCVLGLCRGGPCVVPRAVPEPDQLLWSRGRRDFDWV